jgi:glycosyltransferase involved in cell wall biosynthesis
VVTLHDLIPLLFAEQYLPDPTARAWYSARLELIRHADLVLSVSEYTAHDAVERLQIPSERLHVIHGGTSEHFAEMYPSVAAAWAQLSHRLKLVRPGFMLYVGALEWRKNIGGLIAGFARLPRALRAQHQVVIVCTLSPDQRSRLESDAAAAGIGSEELVLTGRVSERELGALYRACTLFVYPSLYEGFGLPIVEAMSCGAPVAASATTTGPEVLGDLDGTFDPRDPVSIASCLTGILHSTELLDRLRERSRRRAAEYTWRHVAENSLEAYERATASLPRRRYGRARLALVTPWPPERSRVADYSLRLAAELAQRVDVDVIVGQPIEEYMAPSQRGVELIEVRTLEQLGALRRHDRVLYCMGNSKFHAHVYELLRNRPGAVLLHDVLVAGFYRLYTNGASPDDPRGAFADRVHAMYGHRIPRDVTISGPLELERQLALGIYMTRELQALSEQCFVHSKSARELLELDRGPLDPRVQVDVLPFGMPNAAEAPRGSVSSSPLVISLGELSEVNGIASLIDAFGQLAAEMPHARLLMAGSGDRDDHQRWHRYATEHAPHAKIELLGEVGAVRQAELLRNADLAAQLRLVSAGDPAVAVADCLAAGVPTIVTDLGWERELPVDVAVKVPVEVGARQLKDRMAGLLVDADRRRALSRAALDHARRHSFARVADAYLEALGLL